MQEMRCAVKRVGERAVSGLPRVLGYLVTARCQLANLAHIARGSRDLPSLAGEPLRHGLRGETETESEQPAHAASPIHSLRTAGPGSGEKRGARKTSKGCGASRASAHTAMARTSGESSSSRGSI